MQPPEAQDIIAVSDFGVKIEHYVRFSFQNTGWTYTRSNNAIVKDFEDKSAKQIKNTIENIMMPIMKQKMKQNSQKDKVILPLESDTPLV